MNIDVQARKRYQQQMKQRIESFLAKELANAQGEFGPSKID